MKNPSTYLAYRWWRLTPVWCTRVCVCPVVQVRGICSCLCVSVQDMHAIQRRGVGSYTKTSRWFLRVNINAVQTASCQQVSGAPWHHRVRQHGRGDETHPGRLVERGLKESEGRHAVTTLHQQGFNKVLHVALWHQHGRGVIVCSGHQCHCVL